MSDEPPSPFPYPAQPPGPGDPQYGPPYPHAGAMYGGPAEPPGRPLAGRVRLGERGFNRAVPRFGIVLAGAGIALIVLGAVVWSSNVVGGGSGGGSSPDAGRRLAGVAVMAALVVAGFLLALWARRGPLVTAGVTATGLGVPVLLAYATLRNPSNFELPVNLDVVALVSMAVWLVAYLFAPVVAGHTLYLGLAATTLWFYLLDKAEPSLLSFPVLNVTATIDGAPAPVLDLSTVATLSLVTGLVYYAVAALLDRGGRAAPAVPLLFAAVVATTVGLLATTPSLHQTGTGALTVGVGLLLLGYGALAGRRFTAWYWSAGVAFGLLVIVEDHVADNATVSGLTLIVIGASVVAAAHAIARARHEPDDVIPRAAPAVPPAQ